MKYDWEKYIDASDLCDVLNRIIPDDLCVVAIAVVNDDTGEAALIEWDAEYTGGDVRGADLAKDIAGDANRLYDQAKSLAFRSGARH